MHTFILQPGNWLGEGKVTFTASPECLRFYTRWEISDNEGGIVACKQQVEMQDEGDTINNALLFSGFDQSSFVIELTNDILGTVKGKGKIDSKNIAWEFRSQDAFEGFEVYELQPSGEYIFHAEYASPEQFRTIIDGKIWLKF